MRLDVSSNVSALLTAARRADQRRPGVLRGGLQRFGSRFIRETVRRYLSGRRGAGGERRRDASGRFTSGALGGVGLNRVTGQAARSFHRVVVGRGSDLELHAFSNAEHVAYYLDDYEPRSEPRRWPAQVPAGALWEEMLDDGELQSAFEDAIGPR